MLSRICCIVLLLTVCTGGYKIRDDEYDWPSPYDVRNNRPDIEALDNLEPYQTDDLENREIFYRVGRPLFGTNFYNTKTESPK